MTWKNKNKKQTIIHEAEEQARKVLRQSEEQATSIRKILEEERSEIRERKQQTVEQEQKITQKEERLDKKYEEVEMKKNELFEKEGALQKEVEKIEKKQSEVSSRLEEISKLSESDAKELLLQYTEERYEKDILSLIEKKKKEYKIKERDMAREILIKSIQQYAGDVTGETTQTMVTLESDDLKGKLIGKEGRNIIAFERATGVSLIIDDAPDTVFLSSFDLFRRYIAKKSLEDLIEDKRIQPARIEEIVEKNQQEAEKLIYDLGRKTIDEMGILDIPEEIIPLIGKFRFRTSYGQNILMHSKEVAYIAEAIARLIGADPVLALR
jgi:ribonuclease Y